MSLFVIYFGTDRRYDDMAHHEIIMGPRYKELLRGHLQRRSCSPSDFSLYLHRPTATDPSLAPPGAMRGTCCRRCRTSGGHGLDDGGGGAYRDAIMAYLESGTCRGCASTS
jgi:phytoene desaturase